MTRGSQQFVLMFVLTHDYFANPPRQPCFDVHTFYFEGVAKCLALNIPAGRW